MRFRKLRIGWSAVAVIACVLLIVLWVRSYRLADDLHIKLTGQRYFVIHSMRGSTSWYSNTYTFNRGTIETERVAALMEGLEPYGDELIDFQFTRRHVVLPHWIFLATLATLAIIPWLRLRFSLRTLLIATTLIAVVLGLVVALNNRS